MSELEWVIIRWDCDFIDVINQFEAVMALPTSQA